MGRYRIGLIGCSGIAHSHINGYRTVASELGEVHKFLMRRKVNFKGLHF